MTHKEMWKNVYSHARTIVKYDWTADEIQEALSIFDLSFQRAIKIALYI